MLTGILSTAYFPNIQYFTKFLKYDKIIIDIKETYQRQTFRNRCEILTANGKLSLSIPILKPCKIVTAEVLIDNSYKWQKQHYRAILSAYKNSAFFDFYIDNFIFVFEQKFKYLIDLNDAILKKILKILDIKTEYSYSSEFIRNNTNNFREKISPKFVYKFSDDDFCPQQYLQVFCDRFDFIENLSFIDLIFNEGPNSKNILDNSYK